LAPDPEGKRGARRQKRSLLTRDALLDAAAREVDTHGYGAVAMHHIARAADVTTGALTFHFPTKGRLFAELTELGLARIRERAERVVRLPASPLRRLSLLVLALLELLHRDVVARAAVRLARELPEATDASEAYLPLSREMLRGAEETGQLREGVTPDAVTELIQYLVAGAEVCARGNTSAPEGADTARAHFTALGDLLLYGVSAVRPPGQE
jgi:AcrR family transcriptional regulator